MLGFELATHGLKSDYKFDTLATVLPGLAIVSITGVLWVTGPNNIPYNRFGGHIYLILSSNLVGFADLAGPHCRAVPDLGLIFSFIWSSCWRCL